MDASTLSRAGRLSRITTTAVSFALLMASTPGVTEAATEREVNAAIADRAAWGFEGGTAKVEALLDGATDAHSEEWGFPMTTAEYEDILERSAFNQRVKEKVFAYLQELDTYAGAWFDQEHDGRLVVMLTARSDTVEAAVRDRMPAKSRGVVFESVTYGRKELERAFDRAWETWTDAHPSIQPTSVSIDTENNRIVVEVEPAAVDAARESLASFEQDLGVDVAIKPGLPTHDLACPSRSECYDPLRAGTRIYNDYANNSNWHCTMAFHVADSSDNSAWDHTFLTAGHCGYGHPDDWYQDSAFGKIGDKKVSGYTSDNRDMMLVKITDWDDQRSSRVFGALEKAEDEDSTTYVDQDMLGAAWPADGDPICVSLGRSGENRCGTTDTDTTQWYSDTAGIMVQGAAIDWSNSIADLIGGDSGSPVYATTPIAGDKVGLYAMGVVNAARFDNGAYGNHDVYFAKVMWAVNHWGLTIYTGNVND